MSDVTDGRQVPPLGYCARCLQYGRWFRAATMWQGTSLCGEHFLGTVDIPTNVIGELYAGTSEQAKAKAHSSLVAVLKDEAPGDVTGY